MSDLFQVDTESEDHAPVFVEHKSTYTVDFVMSKFLAHLLSPDGRKRQVQSAHQTIREVQM